MARRLSSAHLTALAAGTVTLLVYLPAMHHSFVNWDDPGYLYENPFLGPLNGAFLKWSFTTFYMANWHPLTWLSHGIDYFFWGPAPFGHHLTSILLHAVNAFLVAMLSSILLRLRVTSVKSVAGAPQPVQGAGHLLTAFLTGLLFGIHPVHVESAAWVAERKDVLCAFFFLLSILSYLKFLEGRVAQGCRREGAMPPGSAAYLLSLSFFILALLSKPMAVTLPVILIILDWYLRPAASQARNEFTRLILQKIPFVILSLAAGLATLAAQRSGSAIVSLAELPLGSRIAVAAQSVEGYIRMLLLPVGLVPLYPFPDNASLLAPLTVASALALAGITCACIVLLKRDKAYLAIWASFLVTLLPVLGLIQVGGQSRADRYLYLPSIGPLILLSHGVSRLFSPEKKRNYAVIAAIVALLGVMTAMTIRQTAIWKNGETLWTREIDSLPDLSTGYTYRADYYFDHGRMQDAFADVNRALSLQPPSPEPVFFRGKILAHYGFAREAVADFSRAISMSTYTDHHYFRARGKAYLDLGDHDAALNDYTTAISANPLLPEMYYEQGNIYAKLGRLQDALGDYTNAIARSTYPPAAYYRARSSVYQRIGQSGLAEDDRMLSEALEKKQARK